jgi:putative lipoic acid-binding regulatory protein
MAENSTEKAGNHRISLSFPLKVMGERHDEFVLTMTEVVRVNAPDLAEHDVTLRESSGGRFYALTITVNATSRQQLDNIYLSLTGHPMVKMVL